MISDSKSYARECEHWGVAVGGGALLSLLWPPSYILLVCSVYHVFTSRTHPMCYQSDSGSSVVLSGGLLSQSSESLNGGIGSDGGGGGKDVSSSGNLLSSSLALPDSDGSSFNGVLSAEWGDVSGVLVDFDLSDVLSEGGSVSGSVLSADSDLSSSLGHDELLV